jgi:hypothetical protein
MKQLRKEGTQTYYTEVSVAYDGRIPHAVTPSDEGAVVSAEIVHSNEPRGFGGVPADPSVWKEPPHVALANWRFDDVERVCAFTRRYGPVWLNADELVVRKVDIERLQQVLRKAWGEPFDPEAMNARGSIENSLGIVNVGFGVRKTKITFNNLWFFTCALFQMDYQDKRLGICLNPDCATPYFIKARRDQTHCSTECRNLVNVQRWRSDPSNRKREKDARKRLEAKRSKKQTKDRRK